MKKRIPLERGHRWLSLNALLLIFLFAGNFPSLNFPNITVTFTDVVVAPCYGEKGGGVRAEASGGTAPYTYVWSDGTEGPVLSGVKSGLYSVMVTDADGNGIKKNFYVRQAPLLLVDFIPQACSLPLKVTAEVQGGTGPYQYRWSTGESSKTITVAEGVEYCVMVTDKNNCTTMNCVTVAYSELEVEVDGEEISCYGVDDGSLTATVTGGIGEITYAWSNGATTPTIADLAPGVYEVTVTDDNGCSASAMGEVLPKDSLSLDLLSIDPVCVGDSTGRVTAAVSGGTPPYTYTWSNDSPDTLISGLTSGAYSLTVSDANGCTTEQSTVLTYQSELKIEAMAGMEICPGAGDGTASVMASDGVGPYDILWNTGDTTEMISGLSPGTYSVTVMDAVGCLDTVSVMVDSALVFEFETEAVDPSSCNLGDGTASVTVVSGEGPFSYVWSTGDTTQVIDSLAADIYTVTVTNADQCTASGSVTIEEPTELMLTITGEGLRCFGDSSAFLMAEAAGGMAPYSFVWSTGDSTATVDGLPAGMYAVTVTDSLGCSTSATAEIAEPDPLEVSMGGASVVCGQGNTGSAFTNVSGGTEPYSYLWNTGDTSRFIVGLLSGTYSVTVTDSLGCIDSAAIDIKIVDDLAVAIVGQGISCAGQSDGTATATATGGDEPYSYFWSNGDTTNMIDQLSAGTYMVTVSDANNCTARDTVVISSPSPILAFMDIQDLVCLDDSTGAIDLSVMGGTEPYTFEWSTGDTTEDISNLPQGTYRVTITDANDCFIVRSGNVSPPTPFTLDFEVKDVSCNGGQDGAVTVSVNGGTGPYTYAWNTGSTDPSITDLILGGYSVTVTDTNGCITQDSVSVGEVPGVVCTITKVEDVVRGQDGSLAVSAQAGTAPYTYLWSNGDTTAIIDSLDGGIFKVTVSDVNGCTTSCEFELIPLSGLGDYVWIDQDEDGVQDDSEAPFPGLTIKLLDAGGAVVDSTVSDSAGYYEFIGLAAGTYAVQFTAPEKYSFTETAAGANDELDSDADQNGLTAQFSLAPGELNWNIDAGLTKDCINITDPGSIGYDQYLCGPGNDPDAFVSLTPAIGGEGEIEYLWMYSTKEGPFNAATWTPIPNSNAPTYDAGILFETTYFARCARREDCPGFLETNIVVVVVGEETQAEITGPATLCQDEFATFEIAGLSATAVVEWKIGPGGHTGPVAGNAAEIKFSSFGTFTIEAIVTDNSCSSLLRKEVLVIDNSTICANGFEIFANIENEATREIQLEWMVSNATRMEYTIEYSEEGLDFTPVGLISDPERLMDENLRYVYSVTAPKQGLNFYRVKMSDKLGSSWYSNTEEVIFQNDSWLVLLYPNPVHEKAIVEVFDSFEEPLAFELLNITGQRLRTWTAAATEKRNEIDLYGLPAGVYFLRISFGDDQVKTLRIVKK